jgi:hypothetical protein
MKNFYSIPRLNEAIIAVEGAEQSKELDSDDTKILETIKHLLSGLLHRQEVEQKLQKGGY